MKTSKELFKKMSVSSIISSAQGSWKYQRAYRIADYVVTALDDGRVVFCSVGMSGKYSEPQLRRYGLSELVKLRGGLHYKPVTRKYAMECIGSASVRALESRGFIFK